MITWALIRDHRHKNGRRTTGNGRGVLAGGRWTVGHHEPNSSFSLSRHKNTHNASSSEGRRGSRGNLSLTVRRRRPLLDSRRCIEKGRKKKKKKKKKDGRRSGGWRRKGRRCVGGGGRRRAGGCRKSQGAEERMNEEEAGNEEGGRGLFI